MWQFLVKESALPLKVFLVCVLMATVFSITGYVLAREIIREGANDPQIQLAEDAAVAYSSGQTFDLSAPRSNLGESLAPFVIFYDDSANASSSSVALNGQIPKPADSYFDQVRNKGEARFTWEPQKGTRVATVMTRSLGQVPGFILVGRSLTEIDKRISSVFALAGAAWLISVALSALTSWVIFRRRQ